MDFRKYESDFWEIDYPLNWRAEKSEGVVTFFDRELEIGVLQISNFFKNQNIEENDILEFFRDDVPKTLGPERKSIGNFVGFAAEYVAEGCYWKKLFLAKETMLLYITYTCDAEQRDVEKELVDRILLTLV